MTHEFKKGDIVVSQEYATDIRVGGEYRVTGARNGLINFYDEAGDFRTRDARKYTLKSPPAPAPTPAIPEAFLAAAHELVDATDAIRALSAGRVPSGPGARAFDAAEALKALLAPQKPPVDPLDWAADCPLGFSTVAFALAYHYPASLGDGCAIGLEIARAYSGPKMWVEASAAEKDLGVSQVRMYPEDFLEDAVAEAVTKPFF